VLERYAGAGSELVRTDAEGAVTVALSAGLTGIVTERRLRGRYWLQ
jgi:beta-lactamase superfamily II metal-dependent hydrolase